MYLIPPPPPLQPKDKLLMITVAVLYILHKSIKF